MRKTFFISLLALCFSAMTWAETIQVGTYNDLDNALYSGTAEKVQLTADIELGTYALQPNRVVELDLNGFTINQAANNGASYILYAPYNITITNGTLNQLKTNATSVLLTAADAKITLNNVNVTTVANIGVYVNGANGELEINGSSVTAAKQGVHLHSTNTKVTLNSGSIDVTGTSSSYGIYMQGDACAAIVNGGSVSANGNASCGVYVAKGGNLTVTNGTINGSSFAISGNGTDGLGGTTITITDGTIGSANTSLGIYHPQAGTLNISGGTITGKTGVYVKSGTLNVTGGNIVGTGAQAAYTNDGNGASSTGDGLVVDACNYPGGAPVINVTGGNFESANANAVGSYKKDESVTPAEGNISGGTYDSEVPVALCAEGFVPVTEPNAQGKYVVEQQYVAKIGATLYPTLEAALAHASEGAIVLLADVDVTAQVEIAAGVNAIIDLAGHKIEYTGATTLPSGVLLVHNGANLTINDSSDPDAGAIVSGNNAYAAIALTKAGDNAANPAVLTINGGTLTGYYYAITGNGSRHNTITTINGGIINATCPGDNLGIYHPQIGTLTINNGTITAYSAAVEMRAGTLEINGGTLTATAPTFSCNANGSGTTTTGAAIAIAQHTTKKDIAVTINGGTFNGIKAVNESNPQVNDPAPQVDMAVTNGEFNGAVETVDVNNFVTGGTFNAPVAEAYCAPGFVSVTAPNAQGKYVVEPVDYQREVTNTFGTLCLPKDGVVYGATVFTPSYKTGCMIVFDEVAENRIEGGHAYLFQRNANSGRVSVKYDANAQDADIVENEAMVGKSYTENTLIDPNYDHCIVWNDKYLHVTSANVYVGAKCAYIDLNQISDSYVAPVPGRRRISFQDASVNEVTGIEDIEANENAGVQKVMVNGQLYIIRGEQIYNVAGQVVK